MLKKYCQIVTNIFNKQKRQTKVLCLLFLIVFLIHVVAVLFVYYANFQPFSGGRGDYTDYQNTAQEIAKRVRGGNFSLEGLNIDHIYPAVVGYLYALTVPSMLIGQLFNAFLSALAIVFFYLIVVQIGRSEKEGFLVGLIAGLYPSFLFFGSLLLKDAFVVLLSAVALLYILKLIKEFSVKRFLFFYIILGGLVHFRFYIGYAVILTFLICWLLLSDINFKKRIVYFIIIVFLLGFLPQVFAQQGYFGINSFKVLLAPDPINYYREIAHIPSAQLPQPSQRAGAEGSSAATDASSEAPSTSPLPGVTQYMSSSVALDTSSDNPMVFLKNRLSSFIYSLLGPFPWQMLQKRHLFILFETIPWYFLFFFIAIGIIKSVRRQYKDVIPIIIFAGLVIGVLSLFIINFGTITRIRMPAFLALLCLLPFGLTKLNNIKIPFIEKIFI